MCGFKALTAEKGTTDRRDDDLDGVEGAEARKDCAVLVIYRMDSNYVHD
jgi:hypothetical protein